MRHFLYSSVEQNGFGIDFSVINCDVVGPDDEHWSMHSSNIESRSMDYILE